MSSPESRLLIRDFTNDFLDPHNVQDVPRYWVTASCTSALSMVGLMDRREYVLPGKRRSYRKYRRDFGLRGPTESISATKNTIHQWRTTKKLVVSIYDERDSRLVAFHSRQYFEISFCSV